MEGTSLPTLNTAPAEWLEALAEADIAAGRVLPAEQVLQELRASIAVFYDAANIPTRT